MHRKILVLFGIVICLSGCGTQTTSNKAYVNNQTTVSQVIEQQTQNDTTNTDTQDISNDTSISAIDVSSVVGSTVEKEYDSVDIDLSSMSSSLVYSEVLNMMTTPTDYIGKTVKMTGTLVSMVDEVDNNTYLACIIQDATACCAQGIEFQPLEKDLEDSNLYDNQEITVVGTFDEYQIEDNTYYTLKDARIIK